eukprot:jgi/Mesvir1/23163/Mv22638-RA.1
MASLDTDEARVTILQLLQGILNADPVTRKFAEDQLIQGSLQPGYGVSLVKVFLNQAIPEGIRQLAAVVLKQYVKEHWQEEADGFRPPVVIPEEKDAIRQLLPSCLGDPASRLRTAGGMAIAKIGSLDWPDEWPDLLLVLVRGIQDKSHPERVQGSLQCLSLLAGDIDDQQLPQLVPVLFPELLEMVSHPEVYGCMMQRKALSVLYGCLATLGYVSGPMQRKTQALISPMLAAWMGQLARVLSEPLHGVEDVGLKMQALKVVSTALQNFPKPMATHFPGVMAPLWQLFAGSAPLFEARVLQQGSTDAGYDSDGDLITLDTLVAQLFEVLITLVGSPRFSKMVQGSIKELVYIALQYMHMSHDQMEEWERDINQFIADESEDLFNCRGQGENLFEELGDVFGPEALKKLLEAVFARFRDADAAREADAGGTWWKMREAGLLTLGYVCEAILGMQKKGAALMDVPAFVASVINQDLSPGSASAASPWLQGRALSVAASYAPVVGPELQSQLLQITVGAISQGRHPALNVGGLRALSYLCSRVSQGALQPLLRPVLQPLMAALAEIIAQADEEMLALALDSLTQLMNVDPATTSQMEGALSPHILAKWVTHIDNPLISSSAFEVLEAMANNPGCISPLFLRSLPSISDVLAHADKQPSGLVVGVLELLTLLVSRVSPELVAQAHAACYAKLLHLLRLSDDVAHLQNGAECLALFLLALGRDGLHQHQGDGCVREVLDVAGRLLSPSLEESAALYVGKVVGALLRTCGQEMHAYLPMLLATVNERLRTAQMPMLKQSLLLIYARLVHMSFPQVSHVLDLLASLPAEGNESGLHFVVAQWLAFQEQVRFSFPIKLTTTALGMLLTSADPRLATITVPGRQLEVPDDGRIMTRSRAKKVDEKWSHVPAPCKMFSLLVDALAEAQEDQRAGGGQHTQVGGRLSAQRGHVL